MLNTQLVYIRPRDMVFTIIAMVHIVPCHHFGKSCIELFIIPFWRHRDARRTAEENWRDFDHIPLKRIVIATVPENNPVTIVGTNMAACIRIAELDATVLLQ